MRLCMICGKNIDDLSNHPNAKQCKTCRTVRMNPIIMTHEKYGAEIRAHLDNIGWPVFLRPFSEIKENPNLMATGGRTDRSRHTIFCQPLSEIEHEGYAYRYYSKGSGKTIYKLTKID